MNLSLSSLVRSDWKKKNKEKKTLQHSVSPAVSLQSSTVLMLWAGSADEQTVWVFFCQTLAVSNLITFSRKSRFFFF